MARTKLLAASALLGFLIGPPAGAETRVDVGATIADGDLKAFYLGVGEYFRVPYHDVVVVEQRRLPPPEVPVAFFIAQHAHVSPSLVVDLRLGGRSWLDVSLHFGIGPEVFYVPVAVVPGPPYGRAYGYYKNKPRKDWRTIVLADDDVVNLVNLRFVSEHYGVGPDVVIGRRSKGQDFVSIHAEARKAKGGAAGKPPKSAGLGSGPPEDAGKGKNKGQGSDKGKVKGKDNPGQGNKP
jgi:hypothetical protein